VTKLPKWIALALFAIGVLIVALQAYRIPSLPDLEIWHSARLEEEFVAGDVVEGFGLEDYLRQEEELFAELQKGLEEWIALGPTLEISRYEPDGFNNPLSFPRNWNRTFELVPDEIRGGVLLLHGLSDSPYSLRRVGEILAEQGFYVLGLRLPGHGTLPSGLLSARLEDWKAAVELAVLAVRERVGDRRPLLIAGYSNGGTLAVQYALDSLEDESLPRPDRLVLFSPAIGISSLARFADWHRLVSFIPYFEKLRWVDNLPEYDPYKYNSFTKNAATQSYRITTALRRQIDRLHRSGEIESLPPILTFASLVDATVLSRALVEDLYDKLDSPDSELVIFDVNRLALMKPFYRRGPLELLDQMEENTELPYRLTVVTNETAESWGMVEWSKPARSSRARVRNLDLKWPDNVFSLSHVAIPFPPDDPVYGQASSGGDYGLPIGSLEPRGERRLLRVPADLFLRLRHNPFFSYVEERLVEVTGPRAARSRELP